MADNERKKPVMLRRYVESPSRMDFQDSKAPRIVGYAAVFNQRTELYPGVYEEIAPGAFSGAIGSRDIYALWNHDANNVLGNTGAGTLALSEDDNGLKYEIIPPDTQLGRDLTILIKRGDVRKSSFGFNIEKVEKDRTPDGKGVIHRIVKVNPLFDVSPVTYPAYPQTEVHVRMIEQDDERFLLFEDSGEVIDLPKEQAIVPVISTDDLYKRIAEMRERTK